MLFSLLFLLPAFGLPAQAAEGYTRFSGLSRKREVMTCDETYGNGSIPCGESESSWCFNPTLGQVSWRIPSYCLC